MKSFNNRVVVITGAGSGIGRQLALQLASEGAILALADKNAVDLEATRNQASSLSASCSSHELDVSDRQAVELFAENVFNTHGRVNALFNNAGVTVVSSVENQSYEDFEWIMNINFWGVVYCTKAFLPLLKQADEAHIINISSIFGILSVPMQSAYNSTKHAVKGFTEALKIEMAGSNVSVSCVHPGGIKTAIAKNSRYSGSGLNLSKEELVAEFDRQAGTSAEKAAQVIIRGVKKNHRRILVGKDAKIMSFIVRLFPGSYENVLGIEKKFIQSKKEIGI